MKTLRCPHCATDKPETDFRWRNKAKNIRATLCRPCFAIYEKQRYKTHPTRAKRIRETNEERRKRNLLWLYAYLESHPCEQCGEPDILVLDFDHIDPSKKLYTVTNPNLFSLKRLQEEVAKCRVLCSNCHRRHTAKQLNFLRYRYVTNQSLDGDNGI